MLEVHDGRIHLPDTPGLGYAIPEEKLQRYFVARQVIEQ